MPFVYPQNFEIDKIMPDLISRGRAGRLGLDIFPQRSRNAGQVRWTQADNDFGLMDFRGLDGAPNRVQRQGRRTFFYEPGVFSNFQTIEESELTLRAGSAPIDNTPITIDDLVLEADSILIAREFNRMEASVWTLLTTGTLSITLDGVDGTQQAYRDTYSIQTYSASIPFSTTSTATPIRNFQAVQQLGVGHSVDFGAGATAYMNSVTSNNLLNNANSSDLNGRRLAIGATLNNITDINQYFVAQNLAKIQVYDAGYFPTQDAANAATTVGFQKFIPDGKIVFIGARPGGALVGEYQMTRHANNPGMAAGSYRYVIDRANGVNGERRTPANIEVHRGHNGGPCIAYPSAVVVASV